MRQDHTFRGPDGDFHFIEWRGSGPLAHFSHATGFCAGTYGPLAERLQNRLRVTAMDDRGHGRTTAPADAARLNGWDVFERDLERFFEYLGAPVIAMGHSLGAVASLALAVKRPDLIRALVLIDPTILPLSWKWPWRLAKGAGFSKHVPIAARAARRKSEWPDRRTLLSVYRRKSPFNRWREGFLESYVADGAFETPGGTVRLSCRPAWESRCFAVCPHDVWRLLPDLRRPTLVLYGADSDTFLRPAVKRFREKVPEAVFKGFEGTSHFVPMERPEESAEAILSFLQDRSLLS